MLWTQPEKKKIWEEVGTQTFLSQACASAAISKWSLGLKSTAFSNLRVDSRRKSVRKKNRRDDGAKKTVQELTQVKKWSFMKSVDEKIIS